MCSFNTECYVYTFVLSAARKQLWLQLAGFSRRQLLGIAGGQGKKE